MTAGPLDPGFASRVSLGTAPIDVLRQAMGTSRLLDCGMESADVQSLVTRTDAGEAWDDVTQDLGDTQRELGRAAEESGERSVAERAYRAAVACFLFAQMAHNFDSPRKRELYGAFNDAVLAVSRVSEGTLDRVEVAFDGGTMFGWLMRPTGPISGSVVIFGGQSGWGAAYLGHAKALSARGIASFLVEGPGQGSTRLDGGVFLNVDVRAAFSAFIDYLLAQPDLGDKIGLWGNSLGGLYAATTAASDRRVTAVCVNGAPARPSLLPFRAFEEQAFAMLGTDDPALVQANFDRIAFTVDDRIECPLLVLHGGADPIVALEQQQIFLDAAVKGTLRVWEDGEHTIYNHSAERTSFIADWFAEQFTSRNG